MDPMRGDSWILSETMRKTSLRPSRFRQLQNTKSSSLMRQITQPMMYNSSYGRLLRSLVATADSSSLATLKTKLSNHFIPVAQWLNSELGESKTSNCRNFLQTNPTNSRCRRNQVRQQSPCRTYQQTLPRLATSPQ